MFILNAKYLLRVTQLIFGLIFLAWKIIYILVLRSK